MVPPPLQNSANSRIAWEVFVDTVVIAFTVAPPVSLYWMASPVIENCSSGTATLMKEPESILLVRETLHTTSVFESAVVVNLSTVPVQVFGVNV